MWYDEKCPLISALYPLSECDGTQNFRKWLDESRESDKLEWDTDRKRLTYYIYYNNVWSSPCTATTGQCPAIYYTYCYGKLNCAGTSYEDGWFVPSKNELTAILKNYNTINESLKHIPSATSLKSGRNYSSSSYENYYSYYLCRIGEDAKLVRANSENSTFCFVYPIPLSKVYANIKD